ncbi:MAG: hypothetical protein AAF170_07105 [Bacteroidota bacterium]
MSGSSFRFELAPVLQLRERAVEVAQNVLAQAIQTRKASEARVRSATASLDASLDVGSEPRTVHQLGGAAAHREGLARALTEAIRDIELSQAAEANARRQLGEAMREREALVTLRAEAVDLHRTEVLRSETARLDDLVTSRPRPAPRTSAPPPQA